MNRADLVWQRMTSHIGGAAGGAVLLALDSAGPACREGYRAMAERVLATLGARRTEPPAGFSQSIAAALAVQRAFAGTGAPGELTRFVTSDREGALLFIEGPVAAAVMTELALAGAFDNLAQAADDRPALMHPCLDFMAALGWWNPSQATLTESGRIAAAMAPQYFHTAGYLPLYQMLPQLVTGNLEAREAIAQDRHLRRDIDIASSTRVLEVSCREPLRRVILPLFDRPLAEQPAALVDMGCGEGTLLTTVYADILSRTIRGKHLATHPLPLIGVDPSPVARRVCTETLAATGARFHVLDGDIGKPRALCRGLRAIGIEPEAVLHLNKSVLHNRRLEPSSMAFGTRRATTENVFATDGGDRLPAEMVELDLVRLLKRWRPYASRHGMLIIEAHTMTVRHGVAPGLRSILACLDATHGFSGQYLLEAAVFQGIVAEAGWHTGSIRTIGTEAFGSPVMSIGHYRCR